MKAIHGTSLAILLAALLPGAPALSQQASLDGRLQTIAQEWDRANFDSLTADARREALAAVVTHTNALAQLHPESAEVLVWDGIALSSLAGAKGGLGALSLARQSRARLQAALAIDPAALNGSAYTSLGVLYYKVPGFPLGFGNHDKAREYLRKALEINPDGLDPNYFYAELLFEDGDYAQALRFLEKAQAAAPREHRPIADRGRRREIADLLQRAQRKLG